jgi:ergothioneine biosynthesis glutamate--cysteine ligase EgtA
MEQRLTPKDARAHISGVCFKTGPPPALVGVELEWVVHDLVDPLRPIDPARIDRALEPLGADGALPGGSALSREPGGQVELSSRPGTLGGCLDYLAADTAALRTTLAEHGMTLAGWGLEPFRERERVLHLPRYDAMEEHFDRGGPWGRRMMRSTAGAQINLDAGQDAQDGMGITGWRRRWQLAHRVGPVLVAAFANSPLWLGKPTGWRSSRQAVWSRMDASRTRPPEYAEDPRAAWADYAMDAAVLCIRRDDHGTWSAPAGLTLRGWLDGVPGLRPPTVEDLDYHLTTLFPPVRPRGWLELRMIDTQHGDEWVVPAAVSTALFDDPVAAEAAWEATEPLCTQGPIASVELWERAARHGLAAPELAKAALTCFAAAENALASANGHGTLAGAAATTASVSTAATVSATTAATTTTSAGTAFTASTQTPDSVRRAVSAFIERYVARGRCPADDRLDALHGGASSVPLALEEAWR